MKRLLILVLLLNSLQHQPVEENFRIDRCSDTGSVNHKYPIGVEQMLGYAADSFLNQAFLWEFFSWGVGDYMLLVCHRSQKECCTYFALGLMK